MKQRAKIENWMHVGGYLIGTISDHPRQADFTKPQQRTTLLVHFDPYNNIAETQNTVYTLGTRAHTPPTVADTIFAQYVQATQDAEEIWGLGDDIPAYCALMERIIADAQDRIQQAKASV